MHTPDHKTVYRTHLLNLLNLCITITCPTIMIYYKLYNEQRLTMYCDYTFNMYNYWNAANHGALDF